MEEEKPCSCNENIGYKYSEIEKKNLDRRSFFYLVFCLLALFAIGGLFIYKKFDVFWWFLLFLLIIPYSGCMGYTIAQLTESTESEIENEE